MSMLSQYQRSMQGKNIVGGPYNEPQAWVQRGFVPNLGAIPFKDGVQVRASDNVNYYNPPIWTGADPSGAGLHMTSVGGSIDNVEFFLQFNEPLNKISTILIPFGLIDLDLDNSGSIALSDYSCTTQVTVAMTLIKTSMALGQPFGLDALTGQNSAWNVNSSAHGTLYQDPLNFDDLEGSGHPLWQYTYNVSFGPIIGSGNCDYTGFHESQQASPSNRLHNMQMINFNEPKTDGPYYGIHLFFRSSNLGADDLVFWDEDIDWDFTCGIPNQRVNVAGVLGFAFDENIWGF